MRIAVLHRRIVDDACVLHEAVRDVLPVQLPDRYQTRAMSVRALVDRLNHATNRLGIYNEIQLDKELEDGQIVSTGLWLSDGELPENGSDADIRILFHVHPNTKRVRLTALEWQRRRYYWWQMVMHELIHRYQDTYREGGMSRIFKPWSTNRDVKAEQEYYGDYDEIETHSHDAALELALWWKDLSLRDALKQAVQHTGRAVTPTYNYYMQAFAESPHHPAVRIFKRKLRAWHQIIRANPYLYETLQLPTLIP